MLTTPPPVPAFGESTIFQQLPLPSWIVSAVDGAVLAANAAAANFYPRLLPILSDHLFVHYLLPEEQDQISAFLQKRCSGEARSLGVVHLLTKADQEQMVELVAGPVRSGQGINWLITAVPVRSEKPQKEIKLPENAAADEMLYRNLIHEGSHGTLLCEPEGTISFITPAVEAILGFCQQEVIGLNVFSFVHPQDMELALHSFNLEMAGTPEAKSIVIRLKNNRDDYTWCLVRGHNLLQHPGIKKFAIYFHDDSQRKLANDALKASEARFRTLVCDLQVGVLLLNSSGEIQSANPALCRILNLPEVSMLGNHFWDLMPLAIDEEEKVLPKEQRPLFQSLQQKVAIRHRVNGYWLPKQNRFQWLLINADPVLDESGNLEYLLCSFTDITERKRLTQKLLEEKVNRQRLLAQATLDAQEKERREIGKELHDNIGQQLTTIKLYLDMAESASSIQQAKTIVAQALQCVQGTINEVRQISRLLVPHSLLDLGLIASLNELCATVMRTTSLSISLTQSGFTEQIADERMKLTIFRIVQEQLTNIIKHADAKTVAIQLEQSEGKLHLNITDDGRGFDPVGIRKGLGLINMQNRAELVGGTMQIISAAGSGCHLKIRMPIG